MEREPSRDAVRRIYRTPLLELVHDASDVHRRYHDPTEMQCSTLLSVKTGTCPEDCGYCPQSAHHRAELDPHALLSLDDVLEAARRARRAGSDRFCMGAAWREVRDGREFDRVVEMIAEVKKLGLETCVTLGMLEDRHARRLRDAGLDFYNHNLDTSPEFYPEIVSTRTFEDRLRTLARVRDAGIKVCCGGVLGMGESEDDRISLLRELAVQDPHPESVPVNALVPVPGTPLGDRPPVRWDDVVRVVAAARILMPRSTIRLSAGRDTMSEEGQALCFLAGANSIFLGDQLLTTPNPEPDTDAVLLSRLGLRPVTTMQKTVSASSSATPDKRAEV